jgi:hypothetical protein
VDEVGNLNRVDVAELVARHQIDHDTLRGLACCSLAIERALSVLIAKPSLD